MVGCGSSARVANSPNAILPPELAMISSNSKARSTDCTPDLADDSSANENLLSSIQPSTPLSDKHISYGEIFREPAAPPATTRVRHISAIESADWILATVCF